METIDLRYNVLVDCGNAGYRWVTVVVPTTADMTVQEAEDLAQEAAERIENCDYDRNAARADYDGEPVVQVGGIYFPT